MLAARDRGRCSRAIVFGIIPTSTRRSSRFVSRMDQPFANRIATNIVKAPRIVIAVVHTVG